jgi:hypothetical protein
MLYNAPFYDPRDDIDGTGLGYGLWSGVRHVLVGRKIPFTLSRTLKVRRHQDCETTE